MSNYPPPPGSEEPTGSGDTPPAPPNPYGTPQPPPYGQPQVPYGQPPAGPAYPAYGQSGPEEGGKGLAITSLVLAFIPCLNLVAIVLALVVLIGKKAGKGLAIAALVISVAWAAVAVVLVLVAGSLFGVPIDDLETGQCFTADGLTDSDGVSQIDIVSCSDSHDGEVLATNTLDADEAEAYKDQTGAEACGPIVDAEVVANLPADVTVTALTQDEEPDEGDKLACVAYHVDGDKLTEKLG